MIRVEELTKDYGSRRALHGLTFEARQGEVVGFLGPNGAGKTTTMRILTSYMPPTSGEAIVAGYNVVSESLEVRKRVGYLPETVPLYTDMVVFDYLKFMADLRHLPNADERVGETLEMVGLLDRANGYIGALSKGMRQRIGLAQALLHRPEVLILDEPTIGLDPGQVVEIRHLIREIGKERTVLLSTHILSEAQQICDRVLIINKGRIVVEDTPENLQSRLVGAERVILRVGGDSDGLAPRIEKVKGVQQVKSNPDGSLEFQFLPAQDVRQQVAKTVIEAGYDLIEMRAVGLSLEEIFLELTKEEEPDKKKKARS
ncbi:MAG: ATP-binding cassette domain-containing protein [Chloroflexi bacterium]|nr:ATP-binding cassette domain-containing protein [Chloroflexota bacterium]